MIQCALCMYAGNPETATICVKCKTPLAQKAGGQADDPYIARRGETVAEEFPHPHSAGGRRQTVAEGVPPAIPGPSRPSDNPPLPRWSDSGSGAGVNNAGPANQGPGNAGGFGSGNFGQGNYNSGNFGSNPPPVSNPGGQARDFNPARRHTMFIGAPVDEPPVVAGGPRPPQPAPPSAVRKIVAVLVTYSWREEGQLFPVYQGRNYIGTDPKCEICVPNDATLSGINTSINHRGQFMISDKDSMSGTDLDGTPVTEGVPLRNYATIRTGSTYWTFISIQS